MNSSQAVVLFILIIFSSLIPSTFPESILEFPDPISSSHRKILKDDLTYCKSWSYTVEANDANPWKQVPIRCTQFVKDYFAGGQYLSDSNFVADQSLGFATTVNVAAGDDAKDVWIFDIDETLLSNLPYYADHNFGTEIFDETTFNEWADSAQCPGLPASLKLYNNLLDLGFRIVLLTGRAESQRNGTVKNLLSAGYRSWERLILRRPSDHGTTAVEYKSKSRMKLEAEGYRIHGNSGDQWSDLYGSPMATRSFKLPNPMYYIA